MEIRKATIYGFGKWVDESIDFSEQSILCIYGENESGKSTLHKFILFILFGLPPKQRMFYRPKTSSKMGGSLTVVDREIGEFTIERLDEVRNGAAICYTSTGEEYDEAWFQKRLNGMNEKTYQSIFSFSASDLSPIQTMKEDDIGEILLGIGLTGSTHIYSLEKQLDTKLGELFKPSGKNPTINKQIESLQALQRQVDNYKNVEATYREKQEKRMEITNEISGLQTDLRQQKELCLLIEKQQQALPAIHDYHAYTSRLAELPAKIPFPENGMERLQVLKASVLPLQSELSVLKANEKKYTEKKEQLKALLAPTSHLEQAQQILGKQQQYRENGKERGKLEQTIDKLHTEIDIKLAELNIGLTPKALASIHFPFQIEKTWNELKNQQEHIQLTEEQLQQEQQLLINKQSYLETQLQEIEAELLTTEKRNELQTMVNEHQEYTLLNKLQEDTMIKQAQWRGSRKQREANSKKLMFGMVGLAIILLAVAWFSQSFILLNAGIIGILFGVGQLFWTRKSIAAMEKLFHMEATRLPELHSTPQEREKAQQLLSIDQENKNELANLYEQLKESDIQRLHCNEKSEVLQHKRTRLYEQISEQHVQYPFLQQVDIAFWPELFHTLKDLIRVVREQHEIMLHAKQLQERQQQYMKQLDMFIQKNKWEWVNTSTEDKLQRIENKVMESKHTSNLLTQCEQLLNENEEQQLNLLQKLDTYNTEIAGLFTVAEVDTEDAYYKNAKLLDEQQQLIANKRKISKQFSSSFSEVAWNELIESRPTESSLEVRYQDCMEIMQAMEAELEDKRQQLANVNADLMQMESSETYSQTMHQLQMEQEQMNQLAKEWAILKTAKEMLVATKINYREKYLSRVMERMTAYFKQLTGDAYVQVFAPMDGRPFLVEDQNKIRYAVNELSQGTIDQLYVSLRIAISEIMSHDYRLPFIIDDAFVHFDSTRTRRVIAILKQIAKKQQIILFTCKQDVIAAFEDQEILELMNTVRIHS